MPTFHESLRLPPTVFGGTPAFTCKSGKLDSVYLCFDKNLQPIDCDGLKDTCGTSFLMPASQQRTSEWRKHLHGGRGAHASSPSTSRQTLKSHRSWRDGATHRRYCPLLYKRSVVEKNQPAA